MSLFFLWLLRNCNIAYRLSAFNHREISHRNKTVLFDSVMRKLENKKDQQLLTLNELAIVD
jgi:hypothetical protein